MRNLFTPPCLTLFVIDPRPNDKPVAMRDTHLRVLSVLNTISRLKLRCSVECVSIICQIRCVVALFGKNLF